jgi:hypothetical protein
MLDAKSAAIWRMAQSDLNCSPASNSPMIRENTGNYAHSRRFCRFCCSESPRLCWHSSANSLLDGTGNFDQLSGKSNSLIDFRSAKSSLQAAAVREFRDRMERRTRSEPVDPGLSEKYAGWIGWARSKAAQVDRFVRPLNALSSNPKHRVHRRCGTKP